jgi:translation initiation factor IF-1
MANGDHIEMQGVVTDTAGGDNFKIKLDAGHEVMAKLSGKLRHNKIRIIVGDRVTVAFSPYDSARGMITFRGK